MPKILDDKSQHVLPFILEHLKAHQERYAGVANPPPFFLGINGIQGVGKTTLVTTIARALRLPPHSLPTVVLSIDDLYLTHADQAAFASSHASNPLVQHRGQPSTHDVALGTAVVSALKENRPTRIPRYDKSCFDGQGDRVSMKEWETVNGEGQQTIKVVILEGWCVGFRSLKRDGVEGKWKRAREEMETNGDRYGGRLGWNKLEDVLLIDEALAEYDALTDQLEALVHIDAEDTRYIYEWRLEQEVELRTSKGMGMTDDQVKAFVDDYYPSYELYTDKLRSGSFPGETGRQMRLVVGRDRKVKQVMRI